MLAALHEARVKSLLQYFDVRSNLDLARYCFLCLGSARGKTDSWSVFYRSFMISEFP